MEAYNTRPLPTPDLGTAIERWFRRHQRPLPWRETYDPYHVWVSEVMAQQTRLEVVVPYFLRFIEAFPTLAALAEASEDEVTAAWSGLGYYRRARMLLAGAVDVQSRFGGRIPDDLESLLGIPGIGPYTAGAIRSIAFDERAPIVDGNVARVLSRLYAIEAPIGSPALNRAAWDHAGRLVADTASPRALNQGLMELGALICTPRKPTCLLCPVARHCAARSAGRTEELPRAKTRVLTHQMNIPLYLVIDPRGRVLMRRESGKLMTSMFHLPHGDPALLGGAPLRVDARQTTLVGTFRHSVTNRRITFQLFRTRARRTAGYEWIDLAGLADMPHPSYVRKALKLAGL
jgi:A/G-specific adenine glycosylase